MSKYVVDIDGVVATPVPRLRYDYALPILENIQKLNRLYDAGHEIVYFTARGYETGEDWREVTLYQFDKWGVKYSDLIFGKPSADYYIDDKFIDLEDL
jgi:CMP-N,N'-diacetyllegionaminic acid synthase